MSDLCAKKQHCLEASPSAGEREHHHRRASDGVDTQVANLASALATEVASSGDSSAVVARCRREYVVTHDFAITQSSPADR